MILYLAPLLDIIINNATIPSDWKEDIVAPIKKVGVCWSKITDQSV
jgi:hypothetical protein